MGRTIKTDVAVFGGGPAGVGAALAAARTGAKTLLVEKLGILGGQMTGGLVTGLHGYRTHIRAMRDGSYLQFDHKTRQNVAGISAEIVERLRKSEGVFLTDRGPSMRVEYDPEKLKVILFEMMYEAGVELLLDTFAFGAVTAGSRIKAVRIANKNGEELVEAKQYVDSTADGDIAAWAGAPFEKGRPGDHRCMPVSNFITFGGVDLQKTLDYVKAHPEELHQGTVEKWQEYYDKYGFCDLCGFRSLIQEAFKNGDYPIARGAVYDYPYPAFFLQPSCLPRGQAKVLFDMIYNIDCSDAQQLSEAEVFLRMVQTPALAKFVRKYLPGFENSYIVESPSLIGARESRRIIGDYMITEDDVLSNRRFPDVVARCGRAMNVHSVTGGRLDEERGGQQWIEPEKPQGFDIPLRALTVKGIGNVMTSGRCISVTHMALGSVRGMPVCTATGEAAGTAAALCIGAGTDVRSLDIKLLQDTLRANNVILD